jgi:hypothetical protein
VVRGHDDGFWKPARGRPATGLRGGSSRTAGDDGPRDRREHPREHGHRARAGLCAGDHASARGGRGRVSGLRRPARRATLRWPGRRGCLSLVPREPDSRGGEREICPAAGWRST